MTNLLLRLLLVTVVALVLALVWGNLAATVSKRWRTRARNSLGLGKARAAERSLVRRSSK